MNEANINNTYKPVELLEEYNLKKLREGKYLFFNGVTVNISDMCKAKQNDIICRSRRLYGDRFADRLVKEYLL